MWRTGCLVRHTSMVVVTVVITEGCQLLQAVTIRILWETLSCTNAGDIRAEPNNECKEFAMDREEVDTANWC